MIDTIHLRIHGLQKYEGLVDYLVSTAKSGSDQGLANPNNMTFLKMRYISYMNNSVEKTRIMYQREMKLPSSNYEFRISISADKDAIDLNFSIPKFVYGTNVLLFTNHIHKGGVDQVMSDDWQYIRDQAWKNLSAFIDGLWSKIFPVQYQNIDKKNVELVRLDLCWNQVFDTKQDALLYLQYQKMIKKTGARDAASAMTNYQTSIFYTTEYYSAKIYHKGTEYQKTNMSRHLAYNRKLGIEKYKVHTKEGIQGILDISERTLRYEVTFRKAYLQYYFWRYYYRKDIKKVTDIKEMHREVYNFQQKLRKLSGDEYAKQKRIFNRTFTKDYLEAYKQCEKLYAFAPKFMLNSDNTMRNEQVSDLPFFNGEIKSVGRNQPFNKFLFDTMFDHYKRFIDNFEVKEKTSFTSGKRAIIEYNENKQKLSKLTGTKQSAMYQKTFERMLLLLQTYSLDELVTLDIISKRTKYDWQKKLENIGMTKNDISDIPIVYDKGLKRYLNAIWNSRIFE